MSPRLSSLVSTQWACNSCWFCWQSVQQRKELCCDYRQFGQMLHLSFYVCLSSVARGDLKQIRLELAIYLSEACLSGAHKCSWPEIASYKSSSGLCFSWLNKCTSKTPKNCLANELLILATLICLSCLKGVPVMSACLADNARERPIWWGLPWRRNGRWRRRLNNECTTEVKIYD